MKKIYIITTLAVIIALCGCHRIDNEAPQGATSRAKITTSTVPFVDADLLADKSPSSTQLAPAPEGRVGDISPLGGVDPATTVGARSTKPALTRAHTTESFRPGDQIGIYVHSTPAVEQGELNHTTNTPYTTADGTTWRPIYLLGGAFTAPQYYITAYYPYAEAVVDALSVPHVVQTDQSGAPSATSAGKLEISNFLIARGAPVDNATTNATSELNFVHAMSLFEVKVHLPATVDGRELDSLESIVIKGTQTRASINLATGGVTVHSASIAPIIPRRVSGSGRPGVMSVFEAIVVPQNIAGGADLLEIRCRMKDKSLESFDYTVPEQNWMAFKSGYRTSFTLMPTAEVSFVGELPLLIDGLAHSDMVIPIFVAKDLSWELSVQNIPWMTISESAGGTYLKQLSGSSSTGAIVNVYVKVEGNVSQSLPRAGEMLLRGYRADLSEVSPAVYLAVQNYYSFGGSASTWGAGAGQATSPVAPFAANQSWRAESSGDWVKIARSAVYGDGSPLGSYSHLGSLLAGQLWLQADANNSAGARSATVKFSSDYVDGTNFSYTVNQAAADLTLLPVAEVSVGKDAGVDAKLFTVTAPLGVKWKVLSVTPQGAGDLDMGLALNLAVGEEQVGTGAAVQVTGSYGVNPKDARTASVVLSFATHAAAQQKTFTVKQASALTISVDPTTWNNVSGYGDSKTITVTTAGTNLWTVSSDNANLTVTPTSGASGQTATLTWATHAGTTAPAQRSATVTFATNPAGATATLTTTQNGVAGPANAVNINGTWWALSNAGSGNWNTAMTLCPAPWRLPSKEDFENLIKSGKMNEVTGISRGGYWSSSTVPNTTNYAYTLSYGTISNNTTKTYNSNVRCCQ